MTQEEEEKKLSVEEAALAVLQEHEDFEDVRKVLAMSGAELDQELQRVGLDPEAVDARGREREAAIRKELDRPLAAPWWRRWTAKLIAVWTALWVVLTAAATHVVDVLRAAGPEVTSFAHAAPPDLRKEAFEECGKTHWQACLDKLDEAAKVDPDGDKNEDVQQARKTAKEQLNRTK